ncbi:reverse transcriptase domain-containing protein [Tanacetum coccineum]
MKKLMKAKFLLENHCQEAFLNYHNLSQQNMIVEEVINEFDKLHMRCDVVEEEEQVVARFLGVVKPKIADITKAKSKGSTSCFTLPTKTAPPTAPKTTPKATTHTTLAAGNTKEHVDNAPHCYKCAGLGYYARDCPNLKTPAFVLDDAYLIYDTKAEPKLDKPGDELVYPDRGEALFSIGKSYKDEVWCEVISMDAAHILLGHPWKFDRKKKHDGFQNTYSFKKDGVNITLVPFDSQENDTISEASLQVQPLLREFADVIPGDIPPGLPAMRDI